MMRQIRHPLVRRDVIGISDHILETTQGDLAPAERRLDEIDDLLEAISGNPASGARLDGHLAGWLARHGGRGQMITMVFRAKPDAQLIYIALIAFGARNWLEDAVDGATSGLTAALTPAFHQRSPAGAGRWPRVFSPRLLAGGVVRS